MADTDKYPTESGRRRFVKGVVGSATLAGIGTAAASAVGTATHSSGAGGGPTTFVGIENTRGPAPRGMPMIPLETDSEGFLKGVWPDEIQEDIGVMEIAGQRYTTSWFQYCGVQTYPGVRPGTEQDNFFRSASGPQFEWQEEEKSAGDKLHVDDFSDYETWNNGIGDAGVGKPASASWRSVDLSPQETMPVQVLRSPRVEELANSDGQTGEWFSAATEDGFMAWLNKCSHFCCVPGFKSTDQAVKFGAENEVYCPCHQSVYDPFTPVFGTFIALPRPE